MKLTTLAIFLGALLLTPHSAKADNTKKGRDHAVEEGILPEEKQGRKSSASGFGHTSADHRDAAPVKLEHFVFPISESVDETLRMFINDFDLNFKTFLQEQGITFPQGAECNLDSEKNRIEVTLEHGQAALVIWVLGDLMNFKNSTIPPTREALFKRYYSRLPEEEFDLRE